MLGRGWRGGAGQGRDDENECRVKSFRRGVLLKGRSSSWAGSRWTRMNSFAGSRWAMVEDANEYFAGA